MYGVAHFFARLNFIRLNFRVYCLSYYLSNCRILQFLHKIFSVSLLLDYALLKCFITEVVLFSVVD